MQEGFQNHGNAGGTAQQQGMGKDKQSGTDRIQETADENQQKFFISINEWIFSMMEEMDRNRIEAILNQYVETRKRDDQQNRDENRRYFIKSLPEDEYENVCKVVKHMIEMKPEIEKYF